MDRICYIEYLLKNYHRFMRDINQLKLELEYYEYEKNDKTIEGMVLRPASGENTRIKGKISDSTGNIALIYREVSSRLNETSKRDLSHIVRISEMEMKKLIVAIDALDENISNVVKDLYISRRTWDQICNKYYITPSTLNRYRKRAISEIASSFNTRCMLADLSMFIY